MDCKDYREAIAADPSESFGGGHEHAGHCPSCSAFKAEVRALDERIGRALKIDVPELKVPVLPPVERGHDRTVADTQARRSRTFGMPAWIGLAAGVAIAFVLAVRGLPPGAEYPPLAEQVLAHMDHEQSSRRVTSVAVSDQSLAKVLDPKVSRLDAGSGIVSYAMSCVINGHTVPHLVVQGRSGPVTLILMPEETISAAIPLEGESVHGVILPVGRGSVAIVGNREDQLNEVRAIGERVVDSVKWRL